jgi:hypothetical protein
MNLAGGNIVVSVFPDMPTPGALGAFTRPEKINEIQELEKSKTSRLWKSVRSSLTMCRSQGILPIRSRK